MTESSSPTTNPIDVLPPLDLAPERVAATARNAVTTRRVVLLGAGAAALTTACLPTGGGAPAAGGAPGAGGVAAPPTVPPTSPPMTAAPPSAAPPTAAPTTAAPTTAPTTTAPTAPTTTVPPLGVPAGLGAALVVDKLTFGAKPGLRAQVEARGIGAWIEDQLDPAGRGVAHAEQRVAGYATLTNTHRQNYELRMQTDGEDRLFCELDHATLQRAVYSDRQLYELMCDFWTNHFNVWRQKNWMSFLINRSIHTVIRPHALGRFEDLLWASAHDTTMLNYLDNLESSVLTPGGVNENYAREILELHTLGIVDGQHVYTEADVRGVAQLLSGWGLNWDDNPQRYNFKFLPWAHDRAAVSILGGSFTRPARAYGEGLSDGERLLGVLARHPSTARHLATKLCRRFVGDTPPPSLVASAATVYLANDTAIVPVLRHIFASAEFAASGRSKVRRPFEQLVAVLRATNASMPTAPLSVSARMLRGAHEVLGQPLYERVSPDGYPDSGGFWATSDGLLKRWQGAALVTHNGITAQTNVNDRIRVDLGLLIPSPAPATVGDLVSWVARELGNFDIPGADITTLCAEANVPAGLPSSVVTSNPAVLAFVVAIVLSHPTFLRR